MVTTSLFVEKMNALVDEELAEGAGNLEVLAEEVEADAESEEPLEVPVEIQTKEMPEDELTRDPEE